MLECLLTCPKCPFPGGRNFWCMFIIIVHQVSNNMKRIVSILGIIRLPCFRPVGQSTKSFSLKTIITWLFYSPLACAIDWALTLKARIWCTMLKAHQAFIRSNVALIIIISRYWFCNFANCHWICFKLVYTLFLSSKIAYIQGISFGNWLFKLALRDRRTNIFFLIYGA